MFIFGNLFIAIAKIIDIVLTVMYWLILARAVISWVNPDPYNTIVQFLYRTTEPVLKPIRERLPATVFDISPIIAFVAIVFIKAFLVASLFDLGSRFR